MLFKSTIAVENFLLRNEVLKRIREIISLRSMTEDMSAMLKVLKILAFDIQQETNKFENRSSQYYEGLSNLIEALTPQDVEGLKEEFLKLITELTIFISERDIKEKNTTEVDFLLQGKMQLLKALL